MLDTCHTPLTSCNLLVSARNMVVPIHERAIWILPPCPDMEFEERHRNAETVWSIDVIHKVTIHLRSGVGGKGASEDNELDARQLELTVRLWLIDQRCWFGGVNGPVRAALSNCYPSDLGTFCLIAPGDTSKLCWNSTSTVFRTYCSSVH